MSASGAARELPADRYHTGLRLASLAWWLATTAALFFGGLALIGLWLSDWQTLLWLPWLLAVLFASQYIGQWGEAWLMRRWPSARAVRLAPAQIALRDKGREQTIDLAGKVNYWRWRFVVRGRRGGRVANGHICCALQLVQADAAQEARTLSLYAFLPPEPAQALHAQFPFYELRPANDKSASAGRSPLLGGREAVFLSAEATRWDHGAELDPDDLVAVLQHLRAALADFSAVSS